MMKDKTKVKARNVGKVADEVVCPEPTTLYSPNEEYLESNVGIGEIKIPAVLFPEGGKKPRVDKIKNVGKGILTSSLPGSKENTRK